MMRAIAPWLMVASCTSHQPAMAPALLATPAPATIAALHPPPVAAQPSWIGVRFVKNEPRVAQVIPGAPAERGALEIDDEVHSIDGQPVTTAKEITTRISATPPGTRVVAVVRRGDREIRLSFEVEPRPDVARLAERLVDQAAPPFAAQLVHGSYPARLADLGGHVVILDFWATWCGPCALTMPVLDAWQTKYGPRGLRIVGLTSEDEVVIKTFLTTHALSYTIARDADDQIGQTYLRQAVPTLVVIDRAGKVRSVMVGVGDFATLEQTIVTML